MTSNRWDAKEIILGQNAHLQELGVAIDFASLGKEGYVIRTVGDHLVIAGGPVRGAMYGVYGLLEDHLGCRWFAPGVSRIPKSARLAIGPLDDRQVPALEYREPYVYECTDGDWCARNRMNSSSGRLDAKHGGKVQFGGGFFVHTFSRLVPPEKYFKDHPEYFSLVNGQRQNGYAQLCCTNEDVIRICTEEILKAMRAQPEATVFSVSQNDCDKHCRCPRCQALAKREGSRSGAGLATGQSRGRGGGKGVSRQDRGNAGLPVDPPAAQAHPAAAERHHPALLDRVLLLASFGHVHEQLQSGISR